MTHGFTFKKENIDKAIVWERLLFHCKGTREIETTEANAFGIISVCCDIDDEGEAQRITELWHAFNSALHLV